MSKIGKITVKDPETLEALLSRDDPALEGVELVYEPTDFGEDTHEPIELSNEEAEEYLAVCLSAKTVTPAERKKLLPLLKHYAKKPHPFTSCVRDNRKRFGPLTNRYCAVLKDLIMGTTKWRGKKGKKGAKLSAEEHTDLAAELSRELSIEIPDGFFGYITDSVYPELGIAPELDADGDADGDAGGAELASQGEAYNDDQWLRATILHVDAPPYMLADDYTASGRTLDRSKHQIPIREADGTLDTKSMWRAVDELMKSRAPQEKVKHAAQELMRAFRQVDDNAPDRLLGLAGEVRNRYAEFSAEEWAGVELAEEMAVDAAVELSGKEGERKWKIPAAAKKAAKAALDLRKKSGEDFGTDSGVEMARYLSANAEMDEARARKIRGYFKRHDKSPGEDLTDKKTNGGKSAGLWGGLAMRTLTYGIANLSAPEAILTPVEFSASELAASVVTPESSGGAELASKSKKGFKRFWKNLLPVDKKVNYTYPGGIKATLDLSKKSLTKAVSNHKKKAIGAVPVMMVGPDGRHSSAPELARGVVSDMRIKGDHLQALIEPRTKEAEAFFSNFPEAGISAKYYENYTRASDNKHFGPTIAHAAVVWEPHIEGMGPFEAAAKLSGLDTEVSLFQFEDPEAAMFSAERDEEVIDLSQKTFESETEEANQPDDGANSGKKAAQLSRGGSVKFKEIRDGVPVFEDEDGNEVELSAEDQQKVAAEMSGAEQGDPDRVEQLESRVAELSTQNENINLERAQDRIEHRLERDYQAKGVEPAFINKIKPVLMSAAATPDAKVKVVELSADNQNVAEEKEVGLSEQLWGLLDYELENHRSSVELSSQKGVAGAESGADRGKDDDRDAKIRAELKERNLTMSDYGKVAAELGAAGQL